MKRILLISFFAIAVSQVNAQKIYFVYLQTETGEPFFVRMNDNLYSSTASGYLILPRLKDSAYNFKLGFPGKNIDLDFSTSINKKDHGYLIKNFGEKGWGLFDLQSLSIQMSSSNTKGTTQINNGSNLPVNAFTDLLSKAADDPSLKQNPVFAKEEEKKPQVVEAIVKEEKKPEITEVVVKEEKKPDSTIQSITKIEEKKTDAANEQKVEPAEKTSITKTAEVFKKSQVTRISGSATPEGFESVFVDQYADGGKDTVRILIPADKETVIAKEEAKPDSTKENKKFLDIISDTTQVTKPQSEIKKDETKKWWPFNKNKNAENKKTQPEVKRETSRTPLFKKNKKETTTQSQPEVKSEESKKWGLFNKNKKSDSGTKRCQTVAGNDDFLKLRRKMAAKTNDDGMLDEAKKYFKEKCFTTEQIKNLSSMFLSNAGKYNFFETAHKFISDTEKFPSLQFELKDEYYVNRFKTLVGN
jgi:hypothetical protein